jgi:hypothetical protein
MMIQYINIYIKVKDDWRRRVRRRTICLGIRRNIYKNKYRIAYVYI